MITYTFNGKETHLRAVPLGAISQETWSELVSGNGTVTRRKPYSQYLTGENWATTI